MEGARWKWWTPGFGNISLSMNQRLESVFSFLSYFIGNVRVVVSCNLK